MMMKHSWYLLATEVVLIGVLMESSPVAFAQQGAPIHLGFAKPVLHATAGDHFEVDVAFDQAPPSGLFSYGFLVELKGGSVVGQGISLDVPASLNFNGTRGAHALVGSGNGTAFAKGTVDFNGDTKRYDGKHLATVNFAGLPEGNYTLSLKPYRTIGETEQLFLDSRCEVLDDRLVYGQASLTVEAFVGDVVPASDFTLSRQTGLLERKYRFTNTTSRTLSGFKVLVKNLPTTVELWNAHGTEGGIPYIVYLGSIPPGGTVDFLLEYFLHDRETIPAPAFEAIGDTTLPPVASGATTEIKPKTDLPNNRVLLEFHTEKGRRYFMQYSSDLEHWKTSLPGLTGDGQSMHWIDYGPPRTDSPPSIIEQRYYRLLTVGSE